MKEKLKHLFDRICDKLHLQGDFFIEVVMTEKQNGTIGIAYFAIKVRKYKFTKYKVIKTFQRSIDAINFINSTLGLDKRKR